MSSIESSNCYYTTALDTIKNILEGSQFHGPLLGALCIPLSARALTGKLYGYPLGTPICELLGVLIGKPCDQPLHALAGKPCGHHWAR